MVSLVYIGLGSKGECPTVLYLGMAPLMSALDRGAHQPHLNGQFFWTFALYLQSSSVFRWQLLPTESSHSEEQVKVIVEYTIHKPCKTHYQAHMFDSASCSARQEGLYHKYQPSQGHCNYLQHHMEHDCSSLREQDAEWECQQQRCSICSILTGDNLLLLSNPKQIFPNIKMLLIICSS